VAGAVVAVPRIVARVMDEIEVRARVRARDAASVPREGAPKTSDASTIATMLPAIHAPRRAGADPVAPGAQPVDAAVFCPPRVAKGSVFLVQVFLYPPGAEHKTAVQARKADAAAERRGTYSLPLDLPSGTRVDVRLEMPDLVVAEPDGFLIWRGRPTTSQFEVTVPAGTPGTEAIGRVRFAVDGIPAGTLRFKIKLAAAGSKLAAMAQREIEAVRYRRAFVSYSSQDRGEVLRRVQAFRIAGLSVFQDLLDLDPGERWERQLYQEIEVCDVFLLFWSSAAAASEWVAKEIAYALARKAGSDDHPPAIQPVPIEGPPPPPPETLRHLHFNDALLAQIQVASAQPAPASTP
jgi:TIR domain